MTRRLVIALGILLCASAAHAQAFVQLGTGPLFSGNPTGTSNITPTGAGHTFIVPVLCYTSTCAGVAVSDGTNTYTNKLTCNNPLAAGDSMNLFEADNVAVSATTVTITSTSGNFVEGYVAEFSGLTTTASFDVGACASTSTTTANTTTTAQANELVVGFGAGSTPTVGAGFTAPTASHSGAAFGQLIEYKTVSATGVQAATFGAATATKGSIVATFKAAGGGGAVATPGKRVVL